MKYLSIREHSRLELSRKLARYAEEGDDIPALLDFLEKNNWLSQERFSESLVHRRAHRFGNSRIVAELASHGIAGEQLAGVKAELAGDETARACEVWRRKFSRVAASPEERMKQTRFLLQRGFSHRAVQVALRGLPDEQDDDEAAARPDRVRTTYVTRDEDELPPADGDD